MIWMLAGVALSAVQQVGAARGEAAMTKANNEAKRAFNKQAMTQAAKSFSDLAIQKAVLADQTEQALQAVQRQGLQLKSQRGLQAAASDTMGASVDQAIVDADYQVDQAQAVIGVNAKTSEMQLDAAAQAVADSTGSSLMTQTPVSNVWSAALGQVAGQVGSQLLANKMNTGTWSGKNPTVNTRTDIDASLGMSRGQGLA